MVCDKPPRLYHLGIQPKCVSLGMDGRAFRAGAWTHPSLKILQQVVINFLDLMRIIYYMNFAR